ncbi:MAG: hypothetical protein NVSMB5_16850 [Candidatus Velthaea sp.]
MVTVSVLRANGVELLAAPKGYFDTLGDRIGASAEDVAVLRESDILVDRDESRIRAANLLERLQDRPTIFFEFIQPRASLWFGKETSKRSSCR